MKRFEHPRFKRSKQTPNNNLATIINTHVDHTAVFLVLLLAKIKIKAVSETTPYPYIEHKPFLLVKCSFNPTTDCNNKCTTNVHSSRAEVHISCLAMS